MELGGCGASSSLRMARKRADADADLAWGEATRHVQACSMPALRPGAATRLGTEKRTGVMYSVAHRVAEGRAMYTLDTIGTGVETPANRTRIQRASARTKQKQGPGEEG